MLLDDTDELARLIDPLNTEMQSASTNVFAYRRLSHVNKTLIENEQKVKSMIENPSNIDLRPVKENAQKLDDEINALQSKVLN